MANLVHPQSSSFQKKDGDMEGEILQWEIFFQRSTKTPGAWDSILVPMFLLSLGNSSKQQLLAAQQVI